MKINYFSDLHIEHGSQELPENDADLIIAAGDIAIGSDAIDWLKSIDKPVVYICGNHEYWHHDYEPLIKEIKEKTKGTNIHFLENETWDYQGVRFLGCTMWTSMSDPKKKYSDFELIKTSKDFQYMSCSNNSWDLKSCREKHRESKAFLKRELQQDFNGKTVVITHHAPLYESWKHYAPPRIGSVSKCEHLGQLIKHHHIEAWVHGHIHGCYDYTFENTHVLMNTRGYVHSQKVPGFSINKTFIL